MSDASPLEIQDNLARVHDQIRDACRRAGRDESSVRLLAVSKTKSVDLVRAAMDAGQMAFGENYVAELNEKMTALPDAEWHMIGSLQSNKVKLLAGRVRLIHSIDRLKLAQEIGRVLESSNLSSTSVQDVLIQLRIGDEETKHGVDLVQAGALLESLRQIKRVRACGVMCLPPLTEDETQARRWFADIRDCFEGLRASLPISDRAAFCELSIGTSSDFQWAILEGATLVRVGTSIFGSRN